MASRLKSPREVEIYSIEFIDYLYPKIHFKAKVSSGTYIRSLATDIGKQLGTGAFLSGLRRLAVGHFNIKQAHKFEDLKYDFDHLLLKV